MSKEEDITEESVIFSIEDNDLFVNISDSRSTVQNLTSNWTSLYDSNDTSSSALMITNENSFLYWLQMLGIFLGSLLALAIITLITCRRPNKRVQVSDCNLID